MNLQHNKLLTAASSTSRNTLTDTLLYYYDTLYSLIHETFISLIGCVISAQWCSRALSSNQRSKY